MSHRTASKMPIAPKAQNQHGQGETSLQIVECRTGDTEAPRLYGVGSQFNLNTDFLKESIRMHLYIVNSLIIFILY